MTTGRGEAGRMQELAELQSRFARAEAVGFEMSPLGGPVARLSHAESVVRIALRGGQVLGWTRAGRELLWLSPDARIAAGRPIRGGVPVCWPWFGPHPDDPDKPAHGLVRRSPWTVTASEADAGGARVVLDVRITAGPLWPHAAHASLTVSLDAGLSLALTTRNEGSQAFALTQALHTYFRVGDVELVGIEGLAGCTYIDKLADGARKVQAGTVAVSEEIDRIYLGQTTRITLVDRGEARRMAIDSHGSASAVVWNPWIDKTARLGDMGSPQAFREMVCIETANAGDDIVQLAPGASHTLGVRYTPA